MCARDYSLVYRIPEAKNWKSMSLLLRELCHRCIGNELGLRAIEYMNWTSAGGTNRTVGARISALRENHYLIWAERSTSSRLHNIQAVDLVAPHLEAGVDSLEDCPRLFTCIREHGPPRGNHSVREITSKADTFRTTNP